MIAFFVKSSLSLIVFLLFYKLILEREKMHKINRFLLLFALVFSVVIPFVSFEILTENKITDTIPNYVLPTIFIGEQDKITEIESLKWFNFSTILWIIYGFGLVVFMFRFFRNLVALLSKIHESEKIKKDGFILVLVQNQMLPHSFLNYVFVNKNEYENNLINNELFVHEKAHVFQKHSFDILFIEALQIVFWFNPIIYLYKKAIKLNHEFLADESVNKIFKEVTHYQNLLLQKAVGSSLIPIASNLNYSITKKRLIMMTKTKSNFRIALNSIFSVMMFSVLFFSFSVKMNGQEKKEISNEEKKEIFKKMSEKGLENINQEEYNFLYDYLKEIGIKGDIIDEKLSLDEFKEFIKKYKEDKSPIYNTVVTEEDVKDPSKTTTISYDKVVEYQNKTEKETPSDKKEIYAVEVVENKPNKDSKNNLIASYSFNEQEPIYNVVEIMPEYVGGEKEFRNYIAKNFKAPIIDVDLKGNIIATFIVEKDGSLSNIKVIRHLGHGTAEEAIRVLKESPKWKPGIQNGEAVRVSYTLPITLNISSKNK